uniref:Uncharacterized protein n=1 Tax=Arundo donax TaxID=35708 RepID=A0A0A9AM35_ARUDO
MPPKYTINHAMQDTQYQRSHLLAVQSSQNQTHVQMYLLAG